MIECMNFDILVSLIILLLQLITQLLMESNRNKNLVYVTDPYIF